MFGPLIPFTSFQNLHKLYVRIESVNTKLVLEVYFFLNSLILAPVLEKNTKLSFELKLKQDQIDGSLFLLIILVLKLSLILLFFS